MVKICINSLEEVKFEWCSSVCYNKKQCPQKSVEEFTYDRIKRTGKKYTKRL